MSKRTGPMRRERTTFEWGILAVSIAAIAAIVAGLIVSSLTYDTPKAALRAELAAHRDDRNRFVLTVTNDGGTTAEEVLVLVRRGSGTVEVEFRAVPKGDVEEAFVHIGGRGRPTAQVQSYKEP